MAGEVTCVNFCRQPRQIWEI